MKKLCTILLCLTLVAILLAGCAGSGSSSATPQSTPPASSAPAESMEPAELEPVSLRFMWWGGDERHAATLEVIENYMALHQNVTIDGEYQGSDGYQEKLATQLYSGTAAELIQNGPGWIPDFMGKGDFFVDFYQYTDMIDLSGFEQSYLETTCVFDGILVGLPSGIAGSSLVVNTTLTEAAGIDMNDVSWEGLLELGRQLQAYDPEAYLMNVDSILVNSHILRPYVQQLTGNAFIIDETKELGFTRDELVEMLTYIQSLYDEKVFQPAGESAAFKSNTSTNPKWIDGSIASSFCVTSTINTFTAANTEAEYDVVQMPLLENRMQDGYISNPPQIMSIPKTAEEDPNKLAACFSFYNYFFNDSEAAVILKDLRSVPPTENAREICTEQGLIAPIITKAVDLVLEVNNGINEIGYTTAAEVETIMIDTVEKVAYGQSSIETIADECIKLLTDYLANV